MGLPVPPAAATATNAAAPAVAPAAAETSQDSQDDADETEARTNGFGPGRGENAIPVPMIAGIDVHALGMKFFDVLKAEVADLDVFIDAIDETPKSKFPGNKAGKAAYDACRIAVLLEKHYVERERKAREGKVAKLEGILKALAGLVDTDKAKAAGIDLSALLG